MLPEYEYEERKEVIKKAVDKVQNHSEELNFEMELKRIDQELTGWSDE